MVVETQFLPFVEWFPLGLLHWVLVAGAVAAVALVLSYLVTAVRHGPVAAAKIIARVLTGVLGDLGQISPRRVFALTRLAVKESIRRRVMVAFALFIVVLLFAGWFLDPGSTHPARLYLSFVLTSTSYLVLALALFLSALSLPADVRSRTLHTVVTKPVRPSEIVLGRILGFTVIGTVLLVVMCAVSYVFVVRGLTHTHEISQVELDKAVDGWGEQVRAGVSKAPLQLRTTKVHRHRHDVYLDTGKSEKKEPAGESQREGSVRTEMEQGHWHDFSYNIAFASPGAEGDTEAKSKIDYQVGPPRGMLIARVPMYGKLRFKDRTGKDAEKGINVGDEWTYRTYLEGGTLAAAIWTFEGVTEEKFPEGLPLEMTLGVFRTYKGDTDKKDIPGIPGSLSVRNPETGLMVEAKIFTAKEFATDVQFIPRTLQGKGTRGEKLDLFKDLVADGKVEIWLRCLAPAQYYGVAQADLYFRARDASFPLNFIKGYLGIWLQMVLVIGFGVMFSTFLSGPVAMVATAGTLLGGFFSTFMARLGAGETYGGGPVESLIRLLTQENLVSDMEPGLRTTVAQMTDSVLQVGLYAMSKVLPNFGQFSFADYVAYGFNVPTNLLLVRGFTTLGFLTAVFVAGYFFLKTREVAK